MLIPNFGPYKLLPYIGKEIVQRSISDEEERPFSVVVFLEDTRARTKHVYISFDDVNNFHIKEDGKKIDFFMEKNEDGFLISLLGGCFTTSYSEAFELIYPHIQRILSLWCFKYRRPVSIYETRVYDKKHKSMWGIPSAAPNTTPLIEFPIVTLAGTTLNSLVSVFREGMNSNSVANRFINYYKILEAYPSKGPFEETNNFCRKEQIPNPRNTPVVTEDMLLGAYKPEYHDHYIGKKFTWCRDSLRDFRDAIAHPFLSQKGYIDLDDFQTQAQLSAYSNLLERMALSVLDEEFVLWGKLSKAPGYSEMASSYQGLNNEMQPTLNGDG